MADPTAPPDPSPTPQASPHPDAELLAAYERWRAGHRAVREGKDQTEAEITALYEVIDGAVADALRAPARTRDGLLAKLRMGFHAVAGERRALDEASLRGEELDEVTLDDGMRLLVQAIKDLERIPVGSSEVSAAH
jgi:hypothetical protein